MTARPQSKRVHDAPAAEPWMDDGACIEVLKPHYDALKRGEIDGNELDRRNIFFPTRQNTQVAQEAKKVCATCLVKSECLEYAMEWNIMHGVWGGTSEKDRRDMRRRRQRGGAA
jgi:WhiB family redox-sensing transcriptional regulator